MKLERPRLLPQAVLQACFVHGVALIHGHTASRKGPTALQREGHCLRVLLIFLSPPLIRYKCRFPNPVPRYKNPSQGVLFGAMHLCVCYVHLCLCMQPFTAPPRWLEDARHNPKHPPSKGRASE